MRNKLGAAALCLLAAAVLYATEHDGLHNAAVALKGDAVVAMRAMGVQTMTAAVAPDQTVQSLAGELPAHDPTVGKLAGSASTSGGSAAYSIPIAMPPGRRGMQPSLSLEYSSRAGNGIAGMGWSLSGLSSLHRCPSTVEQDGSVAAVSLTNSDKLCLDGQRLVLKAGSPASYGHVGATYDTEIDSFIRVTQMGNSGDNLQSPSTYFEVETKDGDILWYGNNSTAANAARVVPGGVTAPLSWLIERKEDRVGNFIHYIYKDYNNGEVLINSIVYTGFGTDDGNRHVNFAFEPRPISTTSLANDVSSSYIAGGLTLQTQRLTTVTSYYGNQAVRQYQLAYGAPSASTGRSLLRGVTDCAFADGSTTPVCRPQTAFAWQESAVQSNFHAMSIPGLPSQSMTALYPIGDMDGDGVPELVAQYYNTTTGATDNYIVSLNADGTVKGIIPPSAGVPTPPTIPPSDYNSVFPLSSLYQTTRGADFNKDGRIDIVSVQGTRAKDTMWNGTTTAISASAFSTYDLGASLPQNVSMVQVGDFNGDGFNDLMVVAGAYGSVETLYVYLGKAGPSPGVPALSATPAFQQTLPHVTNAADGAILSYVPTQVLDFDGDGMADIILERPGEYTVNVTTDAHMQIEHDKPMTLWFSRVSSSNYQLGYGTGNAYATFSAFGAAGLDLDETNQEAFTRMIDVNGDGLPDLVSIKPQTNPSTGQLQGYWSVRLNNGGQFGQRMVTSSSRGIETCANGTAGYAWGYCSDRWDPTFAPLLSSGDTSHDGRSQMLVPRSFAARICDKETNDKNGEPIDTYWCPQNPANGAQGVSEAQEGGIFPRELGGTDIYHPLYQGGSASMPDGSAYFMDALHFVQTSATKMDVQVVNTPIVYSTLATEMVASSTLDLYGRGMMDSFAPVGVAIPPGTLQVVHFTSYAFIANGDPTWGPQKLPDNTGVGGFGNLNWENFVSQDLGAGTNPDGKTPEQPDLMSSATDGFGAQTAWTYYPLSSAAGRTANQTPLYAIPSDPAQRYADNANVYFTSSMPVVSDMTASDGVGGTRAWRYGYGQAMYNVQGRGFQGFRTLIEEDITAGLRTTTTFDQKFPLAGKVVDVVVNSMKRSGTDGAIKHETYTWLCDRADRTDTSACTPQNGTTVVKFPFLDEHDTTTFDATVALQATGTPQAIGLVQDINASDANCAGTIATTSGYNAYGDLIGHVVLASDLGAGTSGGFRSFVTQRCVNTTANYTATTTNWWLNQLNNTTVISSIAYNATNHPLPSGASNPTQKIVTSYTWNADRTLHTETVQSGKANQQKATAYAYPTPSYGLPSAVAVVADGDVDGSGNQRTRTNSITYAPTFLSVANNGYFPAYSTNALGQTAHTTFAARDGQPTQTVDANGLGTTLSYDPFGQLVLTQYHGTNDPAREPDRQSALTWCKGCAGLATAVFRYTTVQDGTPTHIVTHDLLGRTILEGQRLQNGSLSQVQTIFDALGHVQQQSTPYTVIAGQYWTTYLYDKVGRVTQKIVPKQADDTRGDMVTTYTYSGLRTAIEVCGTNDPDGSKCLNMSRTTDSLGKYMETVDAQHGVTQYWLDPMDDTLALQDAKGTVTTAAYNAIGQRSSVSDPNQGTWNWTYDALGELLSQSDARGVLTTTIYDPLSRPLTRSANIDVTGDGVADTVIDSWTYDPLNGVGEAGTSQRTVNGTIERKQTYTYDTLARPTQTDTVQQIATATTKNYTESVAYDGYYGWPKSIGYPNGEAVGTYYSPYGQPISSFNPADGTAYRNVIAVDARGNPTKAVLGGASVTDTSGSITDLRTYRVTDGALTEIASKRGSTLQRQLDYQTDVFGNLTQQQLNAGATTEAFQYDSLMRMTSASRTGAVNTAISYAYDAVGNFTSKSDFSTTASNAYTYTGGSCGGGANAVKTVHLFPTGTRIYCYDADGNLTSDNAGLAVQYDHDNLPIKTARGSAVINLAYGPDNQHTREWGSDGTKVYLDGGYEDWISQGSTKVYVGTEAEITNNGTTRSVNYLLTDRLGSVDSVANSAGTLIETRGSDAFGKPRDGTWADLSPPQLQSTSITARGFTEHEHLNSVQLIHMNGRVYDYQLGRFFSVDPLIQQPLNSQSLNPYSYIMNNPLAGTDPTGYAASCAPGETGTGDGGGSCETTSDMIDGFKSVSTVTIGNTQLSAGSGNGAQGQGGVSTKGTASQSVPSSTPASPIASQAPVANDGDTSISLAAATGVEDNGVKLCPGDGGADAWEHAFVISQIPLINKMSTDESDGGKGFVEAQVNINKAHPGATDAYGNLRPAYFPDDSESPFTQHAAFSVDISNTIRTDADHVGTIHDHSEPNVRIPATKKDEENHPEQFDKKGNVVSGYKAGKTYVVKEGFSKQDITSYQKGPEHGWVYTRGVNTLMYYPGAGSCYYTLSATAPPVK